LYFLDARPIFALTVHYVTTREVLYALQRSCGETGRNSAVSIIDQLPVSLIAYADCFAIALAIARKARLVTGDPAFRRLEKRIPIDWLARR
jgi:ribonuclease VapC